MGLPPPFVLNILFNPAPIIQSVSTSLVRTAPGDINILSPLVLLPPRRVHGWNIQFSPITQDGLITIEPLCGNLSPAPIEVLGCYSIRYLRVYVL